MATTKKQSLVSTNRNTFDQAVALFVTARQHAAAAKSAAFDSGRMFSLLKARCQAGEWEELCRCYSAQISRSSISRCIEFFTSCMMSARLANPKITDGAKLESAARDIILTSPKPITTLLREMKLIASEPSASAGAAPQEQAPQLEFRFHFEHTRKELTALRQMSPDLLRELSPKSLEDLESDLEASLTAVRAALDSTPKKSWETPTVDSAL